MADSSFPPKRDPSLAALIIQGILRLADLSPFLGKLIGAIAMVCIRRNFRHDVRADMHYASVLD